MSSSIARVTVWSTSGVARAAPRLPRVAGRRANITLNRFGGVLRKNAAIAPHPDGEGSNLEEPPGRRVAHHPRLTVRIPTRVRQSLTRSRRVKGEDLHPTCERPWSVVLRHKGRVYDDVADCVGVVGGYSPQA